MNLKQKIEKQSQQRLQIRESFTTRENLSETKKEQPAARAVMSRFENENRRLVIAGKRLIGSSCGHIWSRTKCS
jgi:hypothetical protein